MVLTDRHPGETGLLGHDGLLHDHPQPVALGDDLPGARVGQVVAQDQQIHVHHTILHAATTVALGEPARASRAASPRTDTAEHQERP